MDNNNESVSRREFVKQTAMGTAVLAGAASGPFALAAPADTPHAVVSALGAIFVPSRPGDPGYKDLEQSGITEFVVKKLKEHRRTTTGESEPEISGLETIEQFNNSAKQFFDGKSFLELNDQQKEQYLDLVSDGAKIADAKLRAELAASYRGMRYRILDTYYKNYPEHEIKRNAAGEPILKPGDLHQITNPNTTKVVTGWDIAGYKGPHTWEEEEKQRAALKKNALPYWHEGDFIKRASGVQAVSATKTGDGHDYYDVIVLGGGTSGCIVAGRLAERGINPKTGDRLRVAMIEGGEDWTIRDPGLRPGYGYPVRRRMATNVIDDVGPEGHYAGSAYRWSTLEEGFNNFKLLGGMSMHWGGNMFIPGPDDVRLYREATGVDWTFEKFGDAIEEIRELFYVTTVSSDTATKGDKLWADAGRSLGFEMYQWPMARRNCMESACEDLGGGICRFDSKGTALPWAYIGLNNGLKVIANADVQKILFDKVSGAHPVATGAVYKDKAGTLHEVRAARVIVACHALGTPLLFYRSGYGPREYLGTNLIVENKNVGQHLDGDAGQGFNAYFSEPLSDDGKGGRPYWTTLKPRPWGELGVQLAGGGGDVPTPWAAAMQGFAPQYGWKHKEYMRNGAGSKHVMGFGNHLGAIPWSWQVKPDGVIERVSMDEKRIDAVLREAAEVTMGWYDKMAIKPEKIDRRGSRAAALRTAHHSGTARAGASRENSVCTSDFDCHDIDHLIITSSASIPRTTLSWGMGPTSVGAAYAWRRILANHFSRGCSTKGFA